MNFFFLMFRTVPNHGGKGSGVFLPGFAVLISAIAIVAASLFVSVAPPLGAAVAETSIGNKFQRALRQISAGNLDDAKRLLLEIDGLNPFIAEVKNNLGYVHERIGDAARAREYYEKALEIKGDYAEAMNNLGYLSAVTGGDLAKAEELVTRAVNMVPDNKFFRDSLGTVFTRRGDRERARIQFERALLLDPDYVPARQNLARLLFETGNFDGCLSALEKLEQTPEIVHLKYRCQKSKGDQSGAFATLRELKAILDKVGLPAGILGSVREEAAAFVALSVAEAGRRIIEARGALGQTVTIEDLLKALPQEARQVLTPYDGDFFAASVGIMGSAKHGLDPVLFEKSARAGEIAARAALEITVADSLRMRVLATAAALTGEATVSGASVESFDASAGGSDSDNEVNGSKRQSKQ